MNHPIPTVLSLLAGVAALDVQLVSAQLGPTSTVGRVAFGLSQPHSGKWGSRKPNVGIAGKQPSKVWHHGRAAADGRSLERMGGQPKRNARVRELV